MRPPVGSPRGVLRSAAPHGLPASRGPAGRHLRLAPAEPLRPFVAHFWIVEWDLRELGPQLQETLPHPNVHLILERGSSRLMGLTRGLFRRTLEGEGRVFGVKFKAGGFYPFAGFPLSRLTGRSLDPAALFGAAFAPFERRLLEEDDPEGRATLAERFLLDRLPPRDPAAEAAGQLVDLILEDRELTRVEQLAEREGVSVKTLQRIFGRYVGVGPKWVIQRYRLHEALERLHVGQEIDWAGLALDLGYFDQPHFIRDFRALVGVSPAEYARGRRPQTEPRLTAPTA